MIVELIAALLIILAMMLWWMISFRRNGIALLVAIPVVFGAIILGYSTYQNILGYPTTETPPKTARLVSFFALGKEKILIWVIPPGTKTPRVYEIPYSIEKRKGLNKARKKLKKGDVVMIKVQGIKNKQKLVFYNMKMPESLRKSLTK